MYTLWKSFQSNLNSLFICRENLITNEEHMDYWKNIIFSTVSFSIILFGMPAFVYGAYLFLINNSHVLSVIEILLYLSICVVLTRKKVEIELRKLFLVTVIYSLSILLLLYTGETGAGMVCVLFSLILSAILLNKPSIIFIISLNLLLFLLLSILLSLHALTNFAISRFGSMWMINILTTQIIGISLVLLIRSIYSGLENQNKKIDSTKNILFNNELRHQTMVANISDIILIIDRSGFFQYVSPNVLTQCNWTEQDFSTLQFWDKLCAVEQNKVKSLLSDLLLFDQKTITFETCFYKDENQLSYIDVTATNLLHDPTINGILINFHDVTERKAREDRIRYLFERDSLTGLYNRQLMDQKIQSLDTAAHLPITVLYGDLNGLKFINDAFGHTAGDQLLIAISRILQNVCRFEDLLFRIGGDEFLMILPKTKQDEALRMVTDIYSKCETYNQALDKSSYFLSISLGLHTKTSILESISETIKHAEDGMYKRKILEDKSIHNSILISMLKVLFEKSQETEEHAVRLVNLSRKIGLAMGLSENQLNDLELVAKLHDIGKIGIDKRILEKIEPLSPEDWAELKKHPEIGYRIAKSSPEIASIADLIHTHHERYDGTGYPMQLKGTDIPLLSRIIAVVDSFDAMTEDRVYRKRIPLEAAVSEITKNSGSQYDPKIVAVFLNVIANQSNY